MELYLLIKYDIVLFRGFTGHEMDNEPKGQAGKRVVDLFSFKIAGR